MIRNQSHQSVKPSRREITPSRDSRPVWRWKGSPWRILFPQSFEADWLERQRHAHMTVEVEYQRDENALTLQATIGRTIFETTDDYGVLEKVESRDFLVRAEDLVLLGVVIWLIKRLLAVLEATNRIIAANTEAINDLTALTTDLLAQPVNRREVGQGIRKNKGFET